MKFQIFLEVAMAVHEKFRIIPMLYGSLGLERRLTINLDVNDVDILVPERYLTIYWEKLYDLMLKIGFRLYDLYDHSFERCGVVVKFGSIESLKDLAGIPISKIPRENSPVAYYLLSAQQYIKVYKALPENDSKYAEKVQIIENKLREDEIDKIKNFIKKICENEHLSKDYTHYVRVSNMAQKLADNEGADKYICALSALLYDLDSLKNQDNKKNYTIDKILKNEFVTDEELVLIKNTISELKSGSKPKSKEGKCLTDACNLERFGAVGIAMGFIENAKKNLPMYQLDSIPISVADNEQAECRDALEYFTVLKSRYKKMFYTDLAKSIAKERAEYMQDFLYRFYDECDGII